MTEQEKQLLLIDLCTRLPYGVIIQEYNEEYGYADNALNTIGIGYFSILEASIEGTWINHIENVKPYLHPMSSMTKEELNECVKYSGIRELECPHIETFEDRLQWAIKMFGTDYKSIDWLNKYHFDYRGLIPMGLALEAPEGMYK